jgi:hypothetical protein
MKNTNVESGNEEYGCWERKNEEHEWQWPKPRSGDRMQPTAQAVGYESETDAPAGA